MVLVNPGPRRSEGRLSPHSAKPSRLAHQREEGAARRRIRLTCMSANPRHRGPRAPCAHLPGSSGRIWKARASRPDHKNLRLPCRKGWLWLAKRALLSWPGRLSRGERLKGKEAFPTLLPRGEWRGRGGGGGCRHEPQREGIMPKSNTRKLNDTQLVILSSASQREDGFAVLPEGVRAASVKAAVIRLS